MERASPAVTDGVSRFRETVLQHDLCLEEGGARRERVRRTAGLLLGVRVGVGVRVGFGFGVEKELEKEEGWGGDGFDVAEGDGVGDGGVEVGDGALGRDCFPEGLDRVLGEEIEEVCGGGVPGEARNGGTRGRGGGGGGGWGWGFL